MLPAGHLLVMGLPVGSVPTRGRVGRHDADEGQGERREKRCRRELGTGGHPLPIGRGPGAIRTAARKLDRCPVAPWTFVRVVQPEPPGYTPAMGEAPESPTDVSAGGWKATFKRAFAEFRADDMMTVAAGPHLLRGPVAVPGAAGLRGAARRGRPVPGDLRRRPQGGRQHRSQERRRHPAGDDRGRREELGRRRRAARRRPARRHLVGVGLHRRLLQGRQPHLRRRGGTPVPQAQADPARPHRAVPDRLGLRRDRLRRQRRARPLHLRRHRPRQHRGRRLGLREVPRARRWSSSS